MAPTNLRRHAHPMEGFASASPALRDPASRPGGNVPDGYVEGALHPTASSGCTPRSRCSSAVTTRYAFPSLRTVTGYSSLFAKAYPVLRPIVSALLAVSRSTAAGSRQREQLFVGHPSRSFACSHDVFRSTKVALTANCLPRMLLQHIFLA